jgi:hypothetical protein
LKKLSTSYVIKEVKIKTTRSHYILIRMNEYRAVMTRTAGENQEQQKSVHVAGWNAK